TTRGEDPGARKPLVTGDREPECPRTREVRAATARRGRFPNPGRQGLGELLAGPGQSGEISGALGRELGDLDSLLPGRRYPRLAPAAPAPARLHAESPSNDCTGTNADHPASDSATDRVNATARMFKSGTTAGPPSQLRSSRRTRMVHRLLHP